jgi:hypothetical protein
MQAIVTFLSALLPIVLLQSPVHPASISYATAQRQVVALLGKHYRFLCITEVEAPISIAYFQEELHRLNAAYTMPYLLALDALELGKPAPAQPVAAANCRNLLRFSSVHLPGYLVCDILPQQPNRGGYTTNTYLFQLLERRVVLLKKQAVQYE